MRAALMSAASSLTSPNRNIRPRSFWTTRCSGVVGAALCAHSALGLWILIKHGHDCHSDCNYCHNGTNRTTMVHQVSAAVALDREGIGWLRRLLRPATCRVPILLAGSSCQRACTVLINIAVFDDDDFALFSLVVIRKAINTRSSDLSRLISAAAASSPAPTAGFCIVFPDVLDHLHQALAISLSSFGALTVPLHLLLHLVHLQHHSFKAVLQARCRINRGRRRAVL